MSRPAGGVPYQGDGRVAAMRAEFDDAFTRRPSRSDTDLIDVLALRIGDQSCVLRLAEIGGVIAHPVLTPVPTPAPALLGLTVSGGSPVAAYDLGLLLGRDPVTPRWLVLALADPGVGLAFEHFDGYRRIPLSTLSAQRIVEMSDLIESITRLAGHRNNDLETAT